MWHSTGTVKGVGVARGKFPHPPFCPLLSLLPPRLNDDSGGGENDAQIGRIISKTIVSSHPRGPLSRLAEGSYMYIDICVVLTMWNEWWGAGGWIQTPFHHTLIPTVEASSSSSHYHHHYHHHQQPQIHYPCYDYYLIYWRGLNACSTTYSVTSFSTINKFLSSSPFFFFFFTEKLKYIRIFS